jgi:pyrimidine-nucleoside phosphorylase
MRMQELIIAKREKGTHTKEEIDFIIKNFNDEIIPDYQMAA